MRAISYPSHGRSARNAVVAFVTLLLIAGLLPVGGSASEAVAADPAGWETLVRTIGFRSAADSHLGQYTSIGNWDSEAGNWGTGKVKARPNVNQLSVEYGLFRVADGKFKLLGANGKWVRARNYSDGIDGKRLVASASNWDRAWTFELQRPEVPDLPWQVVRDLRSSGMDPRAVLCIRGVGPSGDDPGLVSIDNDTGLAYVDIVTRCGADGTTLFLSDSVGAGNSTIGVTDRIASSEPDPISRARFLAPDDDRRLDHADWADVNAAISRFFDSREDFYRDLKADVVDNVNTMAFEAMKTHEVEPGEIAEEVDWTEFLVGIVFSAISTAAEAALPGLGFVVDAFYSLTMVGITHVRNLDLEGPRVVAAMTNVSIESRTDLATRFKIAFNQAERNRKALEASITSGCKAWTCDDHRMFVAWRDANPTWPDEDTTRRELYLLGYEWETARIFLQARGVVWSPSSQNSLSTPPTNSELLSIYTRESQSITTPYGKVPDIVAVTSGPTKELVWWAVGWSNQDEVATAMNRSILGRLFAPVRNAKPEEGGLGLSPREVACDWISGSYGAWPPCDIPFYDAASGVLLNPADLKGMPNLQVMWVPTALEKNRRAAGDPDITSAMIPHLEYNKCSADIESAGDGELVNVYVANLFKRSIKIRDVGSGNFVATLPRDGAIEDAIDEPAQLASTYVKIDGARVGDVYKAVKKDGTWKDGRCLGMWVVKAPPPRALVPYSVFEVHGNNGILPWLANQ